MKTIFGILGQIVAQVFVFLLFFIMLVSIAEFAWKSISAVSEFHWLAGVFLGAIWIIAVFVIFFAIWYAMRPSAPRWLSDYILIRKKSGNGTGLAEQYPTASLSAVICVAILAAIFAFTSISAALVSQGILEYAGEGLQSKPMTDFLFRLYMWHTIDMVPFIDIWKTYDIKPPVRPANFLAQSIVLVFRTAIIGFAIAVIVQWAKLSRDTPDHQGSVSKTSG